MEIAIKKFGNHPSVQIIKENICEEQDFDFEQARCDRWYIKKIKNLDNNKNGTFKNIPSNRLKELSEVSAPCLTRIWNTQIINHHIFPDTLKLADVTPVLKKQDSNYAKNERPVSILPIFSKISERQLQKQTMSLVDTLLSNFLCGYRKGYSTQTALVSIIENWKHLLNKIGYAGAISMNLSRVFDTINHELLLAKLYAYDFTKHSLLALLSYMSNRKQRIKINNTFSSWKDFIQGVPQESVVGPLIFNIYLNVLFFVLKNTDICNFSDDTTPYICE